MKTKILAILKNSEGYISGQEISERLKVSRTAVWKVIKQLQQEGYQIEAVSNKGYCYKTSAGSLKEYEIASILNTKEIGRNIQYFEELDSTNTKAKELANEEAIHGTLVITEQQNNGRGRRGRTWSSPKGNGIWMSLILRPKIRPENASMLTLVAALAVMRGIQRGIGVKVGIKWPNDIVLNTKKICGILTEMNSEIDFVHYVVVGIGINVNTKEFPEELKEIASSIYQETGKITDRAQLVALILEEFEQLYESFIKGQSLEFMREEYNEHLVHLDKEVLVINGAQTYSATAKGILENGELKILTQDGEEKSLMSGEISIRSEKGYA